jgi:L-2-hydroxyglutarate oxidase LhgO
MLWLVKLSAKELATLAAACDKIIPSLQTETGATEFYGRSATNIGVDHALAEVIEQRLTTSKAK